jgi:hypothetical protein
MADFILFLAGVMLMVNLALIPIAIDNLKR